MQRLSYDNAETLIFDPVAANRNATRAALYMLGFRRIEAVGTLEAFAEQIERQQPDLVLCEAQGVGDELCGLIQDLRQGAGYNPYLVIIVTAWDHSKPLVGNVINSGADDLLLRPFSVSQLGLRVRTHIERRKLFVVTTDYVGPDRRRDDNRPSNIELFQPPNSLKMKTLDGLSGEEAAARLDGELRTAREVFDGEKLRRDTFQICVLWRLLQGYSPASRLYAEDLAKLLKLTRTVSGRCDNADHAAAIRWCEEIVAAVDGLGKGVERSAALQQAGKAALKLGQMFDPNTPQNGFLAKIDASVAIIRARQAVEIAS